MVALNLPRSGRASRLSAASGRIAGTRRLAGAAPVRAIRRSFAPISALGWTVLLIGVGAWLLGWRLGWVELMLIAAAALILFAGCVVISLGRARLRVEVEVEPRRVSVGNPATGQVSVTNEARGVLLPLALELPVGAGVTRFHLPTLRPRASTDELFVVPTDRRAVIPVGPATTVRGDPLGLIRRTVSWTDVVELFVHPRTVPLEPLGAGLLRDLEGQTTNDVSMSDLAFHALRDYAPGDDRRYIHWRSSAKAGRFLVRQFLDTRRSHVTVVVDSDSASYTDPDDYETAVSVAASIAVRVALDEQEFTGLAGAHATRGDAGPRVLDTFSRAELGTRGLHDLAARAARLAPDTSIALLLTGARTEYAELRRAALHFAPEVQVLAMRVDPDARTSLIAAQGLPVLSLQQLAELPALLSGAMA